METAVTVRWMFLGFSDLVSPGMLTHRSFVHGLWLLDVPAVDAVDTLHMTSGEKMLQDS